MFDTHELASNLTIRRATEGDLRDIVLIHKSAYSTEHFTSLLPIEVLEAYYRNFLDDDAETILCIAPGASTSAAELVIGFAVFGTNMDKKISAFKRQSARHILTSSVKHPLHASRKVINIIREKFITGVTSCEPSPFLLLSIAAAKPKAGVGDALLCCMISRAKARGEDRIGLYVNATNIRALNRYAATGFLLKDLRVGQYYMELQIGKMEPIEAAASY